MVNWWCKFFSTKMNCRILVTPHTVHGEWFHSCSHSLCSWHAAVSTHRHVGLIDWHLYHRPPGPMACQWLIISPGVWTGWDSRAVCKSLQIPAWTPTVTYSRCGSVKDFWQRNCIFSGILTNFTSWAPAALKGVSKTSKSLQLYRAVQLQF